MAFPESDSWDYYAEKFVDCGVVGREGVKVWFDAVVARLSRGRFGRGFDV
jgi:hypothetical protein